VQAGRRALLDLVAVQIGVARVHEAGGLDRDAAVRVRVAGERDEREVAVEQRLRVRHAEDGRGPAPVELPPAWSRSGRGA
jgi:hypothetical protein